MSLDNDKPDLSPQAIHKAVQATAIQSPLTVYPAGAALLGGVYALAIYPSTLALSVMGIGLTAGMGSWLYKAVINHNATANNYVQAYRTDLETRRQKAIENLNSEFKQVDLPEASAQLELFKTKYDNFVKILDKKLVPGELTYNRYLSIAEQVFLGGLDNLESAALAMHSISAINIPRINELLEREENTEKIAEYRARLTMHTDQMDRIQGILVENEKALTQLDHVSTKIASINTNQGRAQVALEDAMSELSHLIQRANTYSK